MDTRHFIFWIYLILFLCSGVYSSAIAGEAVSSSQFQRILKNGTLRVGVSLFTPWVFKDKKGELVGFEIDVANKLAKDMGVTPRFIPYDWQQLIPALNDGEIDIIIAGMAVTPQRALKVNFSLPYATSGIGLASNLKLTQNIQNVAELNQAKIKIGVISTTVSETLARRIFDKASIVVFQKSDEARDAVVNGKVHAYMESKPLPNFIALEYPEKVDAPLSEPLLMTKAAFAINKGDADFLNFLNSWIVVREADTWLESMHEYWFESLQWRQEFVQ